MYDAGAFAIAVFQALKMINPTSKEGKSELASFASGWQAYLDMKLTPSKLSSEWNKALKKAGQISRNRGKCARPGAVFMGYIRKKQNAIRGSP